MLNKIIGIVGMVLFVMMSLIIGVHSWESIQNYDLFLGAFGMFVSFGLFACGLSFIGYTSGISD